MAYIRKYRDKWRAEVQRNGQRSSGVFSTKREAQAWALEQEAKARRDKASGGHTWQDAVDKYLLEVSSKKDGEVWERRRLLAVREFFGPDAALGEIDAPAIAAWRDARLKVVSGSTVVREANLLRNVLNVARLEWHWIERKPFEGVKLPAQAEARHQVWGWRLIKRVLRADRTGKTAEVQAAFHIALRTGMRLAEVLAAPANYNPATRLVTIKTKTEAAARIPIGRIADRLLQRPAFVVQPNEASVLFSRLCRELMIEGLTFHDARATALTHLAKKVDVMTLAKISRHKDLSLLMRVYYRPSPSDIARSI
jgi:integrase